jgi:hypothetical protein
MVGETKFLTPEEGAERYRGGISVGTMRNWRARRVAPSFLKIGKAILYPVSELAAGDEKNGVTCRAQSARSSRQMNVCGNHDGARLTDFNCRRRTPAGRTFS